MSYIFFVLLASIFTDLVLSVSLGVYVDDVLTKDAIRSRVGVDDLNGCCAPAEVRQ